MSSLIDLLPGTDCQAYPCFNYPSNANVFPIVSSLRSQDGKYIWESMLCLYNPNVTQPSRNVHSSRDNTKKDAEGTMVNKGLDLMSIAWKLQ